MTQPLDIERFRELAGAYGANISRWPLPERSTAMLLAAQPEAIAILQQAKRLDSLLDGWENASLPAGLIERTIQTGSRMSSHATRRLRIWWAGIGIAAALSGAVAGSLGAASIGANDPHGYSSTLFGDVSDRED